MLQTGHFMWILFFLLGTLVGCVRIRPHVMKYETVTPERLRDSPYHTDSARHQTYPDVLQYCLRIAGQNWTLRLERNKDLIGKNFSVTHYSEQGTKITTRPDLEVHCYYHGHIVGVEDSTASVELCSGIKGFVQLLDQMYLIEPLASGDAGWEAGIPNSELHSDEGPHAVYNYKHLRRKRSSCSHGNTTTFYDHGARPSGLFQHSSLRSRAPLKEHRKKTRTVELAVVVDNTEYKKFGSKRIMEARVLEVANHVDKLYRPLGIRVMLVSLDIWSYRDQIDVSTNPEQTLSRFLMWRQQNLLPRTKHDNAQFITGVDFNGATVGLANTNAMCTSTSGAVNEDHNHNAIGVSSTIAHELGHNLGLSHDSEYCICGSVTSEKGCIMAETIGDVYPKHFSSCSQQQLSRYLEEINPACLLDTPSTDRVYGGPVCGNAFLEAGEECDCGTVEECKNPCCNATTCKFNAGAKCAEGECCRNCQLKVAGSVCRPKAGDCDLADYCTGLSATCPTDAYSQNGLPCNRGKGYCYNGQCPSRQEHCKRLWGPDAEVAADVCFFQYGTCRKTQFNYRCSRQDQLCGTLFCSGGWKFPVTSKKSFARVGKEQCNEATLKPEDNFPADIGMVPTGTKCGNNMVCYNQKCQDVGNINAYGTNDCSAKCNNRGVCNHEKQCHCEPGWAPPFCEMQHSALPKGAGSVITVSIIVGLLIILVLVIGGLMCCIRKRQPGKRYPKTTSGQSNPVFRSGIVRGSPRLGSTTISQPMFVESSTSQVYKPLTPAGRTSPGDFIPSRAAPRPPRKVPAVPQQKPQQVVKAHMWPPTIPSKSVYPETKPLPPSRPLPPLSSKSVLKPVLKPNPPIPLKPKPSFVSSPLPHTQLFAGKIALIPPKRPR